MGADVAVLPPVAEGCSPLSAADAPVVAPLAEEVDYHCGAASFTYRVRGANFPTFVLEVPVDQAVADTVGQILNRVCSADRQSEGVSCELSYRDATKGNLILDMSDTG